MDLRGRGAVVTGASGGIGSALTLRLLAAGAHVLAVGRRAGPLADLAERGAGAGRLDILAADVTASADRRRIVAATQALARPGLLVHAAGVGDFGLFEHGSTGATERLFATNLLAPIELTRQLLPLLTANPPAAVVAIGSTFGSIGFPGFAEYSASKFALRGLFEALAREHADRRLSFQWLSPRATDTGFNPPSVRAFNQASKASVDSVDAVAARLFDAIRHGRRRLQLGWPESLFARLNGVLPALVDRGLRRQLPLVRRHAEPSTVSPSTESIHETS